ncbi:hypothetical protein FB451DRAFT_1569714, partial [Mycena latifolia]
MKAFSPSSFLAFAVTAAPSLILPATQLGQATLLDPTVSSDPHLGGRLRKCDWEAQLGGAALPEWRLVVRGELLGLATAAANCSSEGAVNGLCLAPLAKPKPPPSSRASPRAQTRYPRRRSSSNSVPPRRDPPPLLPVVRPVVDLHVRLLCILRVGEQRIGVKHADGARELL